MERDRWPGGEQIAVVLNVMYERWAPGTHPGLGPMGNPLPSGFADYQARSWSEYGMRTGIWRLLELFADAQVKASVYASGILGLDAPESIKAVADAGHELCGHAFSQDRILPSLTPAEQRDDVERTTEALGEAAGVRPRGWMSPRCTPSDLTPALLTEAGYRWFGDVFDADLPYRLETSAGKIVALPFGLECNDLPLYVRYGERPEELVTRFRQLLSALRSQGFKSYIDVTVHAHIGARPAGRAALAEIIYEAIALKDCLVATRGDVVDAHLGAQDSPGVPQASAGTGSGGSAPT